MASVVHVILSHQPADAVATMLGYWERWVPSENLILAYGGDTLEFGAIDHAHKLFVEDPRLRTRDHQRDFQSYTSIFRMAAEKLEQIQHSSEFVHFAEYDHLPLVPNFADLQVRHLLDQRADVVGHHVHRVDDTSYPHFLYHAANERFAAYWREVTVRDDPSVTLSMFGSGNLWTREAFSAVAKHAEPFPMYLEVYLPTLAHHLGFRVRGFGSQARFVSPLGDRTHSIDAARAAGAWTLHPVKRLWTS